MQVPWITVYYQILILVMAETGSLQLGYQVRRLRSGKRIIREYDSKNYSMLLDSAFPEVGCLVRRKSAISYITALSLQSIC